MTDIKLSSHYFDFLVFCSFRYALGRMTYLSSDCVDLLIENWKSIKPRTQQLIKKEIKEAIEQGNAGMKSDIEDWERILEL